MWLLYCLSILAFIPNLANAGDVNAGFVNGFWYSSETIFAEQTTRVYVAIRNNTQADLTGVVTFYDNDDKVGTQSVTALNGRIIESWIDWQPSYGEHTLRAELSKIKLSAIGSSTESIESALAAATDTRFIDYDTDGDKTGNTADTDDDGDGALDSDEIKNNTNPLIYTKPPEALQESAAVNDTPNIEPAISTVSLTEGIEHYLTPSRADTLLTGISTWADKTKEHLDTYRAARTQEQARAATPTLVVDNDGFGTVTRTQNQMREGAATSSTEAGILGDMVRIVGTLLSGIMSGILAGLSWTLGHPMLIQILLLCGILFGLYLAAQKFGSRPRIYKKNQK